MVMDFINDICHVGMDKSQIPIGIVLLRIGKQEKVSNAWYGTLVEWLLVKYGNGRNPALCLTLQIGTTVQFPIHSVRLSYRCTRPPVAVPPRRGTSSRSFLSAQHFKSHSQTIINSVSVDKSFLRDSSLSDSWENEPGRRWAKHFKRNECTIGARNLATSSILIPEAKISLSPK